MDAMELMKGRYSCRAYQPELPTRKKVLEAVEAASFAASSKNTQPWKLHIGIGESCDKALCKAALRLLDDDGRCIYSYLGGSYLVLPPEG